MKDSILKQLLVGSAPLVLVFGLGWLGWEYLNGGLQGPTGPGFNTLYDVRQAEPEWWTRWYPTAESRPISYHSQFADYSLAGREKHQELLVAAKQETESFRAGNELDETSKAFALQWLDARLATQPFPLYEYELAASDGLPQALHHFLIHIHPVHNEADVQLFMTRVKTLPRIYAQLEERLLAQAQAGTLPASGILERSAGMFHKWEALPTDSQALYLGFARKLARVNDVEINEYVALERLTSMSQVLDNELKPIWGQLAETLDSLAANGPSNAGIAHLPEGSAYYQRLLARYSALGNHPDSLFTLAETWISFWEQNISSYRDSVGMSEAEWESSQTYWNLVDDDAKTVFLDACRKQVRDARSFAYGLTDTLPKDRIDFWPTFLPHQPDYQYIPASLDKKRRARLVIGMGPDNQWTEAQRKLMVYEQTIPGLHLLTHRQQKAGVRGDLRRTYAHPAIYAGWAAYATFLLDHDLLAFQPDPPLKMAYLAQQRLHAALLAVDIGMHHKQWTGDQALAYILEHTDLTPSEAGTHLWEIIEQPGKAAATLTGLVYLIDLRKEMRASLGEDFFLTEFHNALLFEGPISPELLKARMRK